MKIRVNDVVLYRVCSHDNKGEIKKKQFTIIKWVAFSYMKQQERALFWQFGKTKS